MSDRLDLGKPNRVHDTCTGADTVQTHAHWIELETATMRVSLWRDIRRGEDWLVRYPAHDGSGNKGHVEKHRTVEVALHAAARFLARFGGGRPVVALNLLVRQDVRTGRRTEFLPAHLRRAFGRPSPYTRHGAEWTAEREILRNRLAARSAA
ncbi:hypothetical protein SAMN06297251_10461 [Fulvimarina manganoxydans]|uniref:Uncharacterized protein n=1 Tax=Fulvimarina manganoxydans TaxID=937218 RepID=A0A1W2AC95_9HYPH|nr:hypothetical protein [Fulvimarina manganoxydans]SMC58240.1 hypothetical protein SAMN06297251_10461 [Fulvimarina manganoxydans]